MRCSGSQTICTAVEPARSREAMQVLESIAFAEVLKPLAQALGFVGEIAIGAVSQRLFTLREP